MSSDFSGDSLHDCVANVPFWWHSIDLGEGVVTPGWKSADLLARELEQLRLPDLTGRSVLDIGAWDGWFSFQAERLGAARVVSLDHYVWSRDWGTKKAPATPKPGSSLLADHDPDVSQLTELPGKRGFDLAHSALKSKVETVVADFMQADIKALGQFDIVLYLGVLYHIKHPLLALERLVQVTRDFAMIETEAIFVPGFEEQALCEFFEANELNNDPSNWWAPNAKALVGMCRAAGFRTVDLLVERQSPQRRNLRQLVARKPMQRIRMVVRARK